MSQFWKFSSILAVLALLVVMGLSTQGSVQAQGEPSESFLCSNNQGGCSIYAPATGTDRATPDAPTTGAPAATSTGDNLFTIDGDSAAAITVKIQNLDLPQVMQKVPVGTADDADTVDGPDANPKTIPIGVGGTIVVEAVHKSSGLVDGRCDIDAVTPDATNGASNTAYDATECGTDTAAGSATNYQVKAFNGNRIQVSYTPSGGTFAVIKTVRVDNGRPSLVPNSPTSGLIVKGNTSITFSADITDSISGFASTFSRTSTPPGIQMQLSPANLLNDGTGTVGSVNFSDTTANNVTQEGGVRLVVAGNVVGFSSGDFTKIDGGWRVSKTLNSDALQAISTNVPWYFEVRDRANNSQRTSGTVSGTVGDGSSGGNISDSKFSGNLNPFSFLGSRVRVSKKDGPSTVVSNAMSATFNNNGTFSITQTYTPDTDLTDGMDDPTGVSVLFDDDVAAVTWDDSGTDTVTTGSAGYQCPFDTRDPLDEDGNRITTGTGAYDANEHGAEDSDSAAQVTACDPAPKDGYEILSTNLITVDSVAPALASGSPVVTGKGYDGPGKPDKAQRNSIRVAFMDIGRAGNAAPGSGIDPATVTASAFSVAGHTVESVQTVGNRVYLTLADNLGSTERPVVAIAGSLIKDRAGNAFLADQERAVDQLGPNLTLDKSAPLSNDKVTITITTDEQLNAAPTVYVTQADEDGTAEIGDKATTVRQTGAQTYSYTHESSIGGEFSVYVTAEDTSEIMSTVGDNDSAADPGSFTFELDKQLNKNQKPTFEVADTDVTTGTVKVEQIDPLIITVNFEMEGEEYDRDSYATVTLTSAKLDLRRPDGTNAPTKTINLTTGVTTPDKVKFTIPELSPKLGVYTLTVQAEDEAGNTRVGGSADLKASWEVIPPTPVKIELEPGWNLISLPFSPASAAINSVIPRDHPAKTVMTLDNVTKVWKVSRRDPESGNFVGDIPAMTANTAYFVQTDDFTPLELHRVPLTTSRSAAIQPPAITVVEGWNLVPVVITTPGQKAIAADIYFGTLGTGANAGWLKALSFETLTRVWSSVSPGDTVILGVGGKNPCTGLPVDPMKVATNEEPCQIGAYTERSSRSEGDMRDDPETEADEENDVNGDGFVGTFDIDDTVTIGTPVLVGKGYWLYATRDGVIIP